MMMMKSANEQQQHQQQHKQNATRDPVKKNQYLLYPVKREKKKWCSWKRSMTKWEFICTYAVLRGIGGDGGTLKWEMYLAGK